MSQLFRVHTSANIACLAHVIPAMLDEAIPLLMTRSFIHRLVSRSQDSQVINLIGTATRTLLFWSPTLSMSLSLYIFVPLDLLLSMSLFSLAVSLTASAVLSISVSLSL